MLRASLFVLSLTILWACSEDQKEEQSSVIDEEPESVLRDSLETGLADSEREPDYEEIVDSSQLSDVLTQQINPLIDDYPADSLEPAVLKWDTIHHDFGVLSEGEIVEFDFGFTNKGKTPLVIAEAYSSCGCTVPSFPVEPILPGKRSNIHVRFNSTDKEGKVFKRIVVLANTYPEKANVVSISCEVKK